MGSSTPWASPTARSPVTQRPLDAGAHNDFDSTLTFNHTTIHGNVADQQGGGVDKHTGTVVLLHTIVAGNQVGERAAQLFNDEDAVTAAVCSLFAHAEQMDEQAFGDTFVPAAPSGGKPTSDRTATPLEEIPASSLEAHGRRTRTHALLEGCPAIDAVPTASCDTGIFEYWPVLAGGARIYLLIVLPVMR